MPSNARRDPLERFEENVGKSPNGHWVWAGALSNGYGNFWDGVRKVTAHRWAYEHWVGPIPEGMQVDHLCRIRQCVNPEHLEAVSPSENSRRSDGQSARSIRSGKCKHGHPMTPENTGLTKKGSRYCRTCRREAFKRYKDRLRGAPAAPYNKDKTHCPQGHPYDDENTYFDRHGGRQCRTCRRRWKERARVGAALPVAEEEATVGVNEQVNAINP